MRVALSTFAIVLCCLADGGAVCYPNMDETDKVLMRSANGCSQRWPQLERARAHLDRQWQVPAGREALFHGLKDYIDGQSGVSVAMCGAPSEEAAICYAWKAHCHGDAGFFMAVITAVSKAPCDWSVARVNVRGQRSDASTSRTIDEANRYFRGGNNGDIPVPKRMVGGMYWLLWGQRDKPAAMDMYRACFGTDATRLISIVQHP